jgi:ribosomal protein S14
MIINRDFRWPKRDHLRTLAMKKTYLNKRVLYSLLECEDWPLTYKYYFARRKGAFIRKASFGFHKSQCAITCTGKSVFRATKLSRFVMKKWLGFGRIIGYQKSSF